MPSDTPLPRANPTLRRPSMTEPSVSPAPERSGERSFPPLTPHDPRTRAALAYLFPLLPGLYLLWRERDNRFVRLHAAQAVIFFSAVALAQIILFIALVALGNWTPGGWLLTALGLLFWAAYLTLGLGGLILWLRMLNECIHGRLRRRPLLAPLTTRLEAATLQFAQSASAAYHERRNSAR